MKTVLLTGFGFDLALGEQGFCPDQWVTKPFPVKTLLRSVRTALALPD